MTLRVHLLNATLRTLCKHQRLGIDDARRALKRVTELSADWPSFAQLHSSHANGVPVHWVDVPESQPDRVLLFAHGGSYVSGSTRSHRGLIWRLARAGRCRVLSVDYRLAPEHPFPAGRDDVLSALTWARATHPTASFALAGDSAGGGLVLSALQALDARNLAAPTCVVAFSPWCDLSFGGASWQENDKRDPWLSREYLAEFAHSYRGTTPAQHAEISPVFGRFQRPTPTLLQVGAQEVLLDDSCSIAERLREAGAPVTLETWRHVPHVWQMFAPALPEANDALKRTGAFLRRHFDAASKPEVLLRRGAAARLLTRPVPDFEASRGGRRRSGTAWARLGPSGARLPEFGDTQAGPLSKAPFSEEMYWYANDAPEAQATSSLTFTVASDCSL